MQKVPVVLLSLMLLMRPGTSVAQDNKGNQLWGWFGGNDVDYWSEGKKIQNPFSQGNQTDVSASGGAETRSVIRAKDNEPFNWDNYSDPSNDLFWDDGGDYVPPRPFRELAKNPTKENERKYLDWMQKKISVAATMQKSLASRGKSTTNSQSSQNPQQQTQAKSPIPWDKVNIIYFYQTSCPHCQRSEPLVRELENSGAHLIPVQLDSGRALPAHKNSIPYDKQLEKLYPVTSTPTWILKVGDKRQRVNGYVELEKLESIVRSMTN